MSARRPGTLVSLVALASAAGCVYTPPPGIEDEDVIRMENVRQGEAWVFYRGWDVPHERARALAPEVEAVRQAVGDAMGVAVPRAQLVVYAPSGPDGSSGPLVDRVPCHFFEREYMIRFRYPLEDEDPVARAQLLGTVGHEVAEATVLGQVRSIDPYLRWMHDGIAELVEHEVLRARNVEGARLLLQRTMRFVADRRARGVEWVDLTRWRQLGDRLHRSQRLLEDEEGSLSLVDVPQALARVRRSRDLALGDEQAWRRAALDELEAVLLVAANRQRLRWRSGEGRTDDPEALDYLFYNAAFAVWLHLERASPGALRRFVAALERSRAAGDHVLTAEEATAMFHEAAGDVSLPPLDKLPLGWLEQVLGAEEQRLE